jgi:hypothetical protein
MSDRKIGYSLTAEEQKILGRARTHFHDCRCHCCHAAMDVLHAVLSRETYPPLHLPVHGAKRGLKEEDGDDEDVTRRPCSFRKV